MSRSRRAAVLPPGLVPQEPKTVEDAAGILGKLTLWVLSGRVDPKICNATVGVLNAMVGALKISDVEARLAAYEAEVKAGQPATLPNRGGAT